MLPSLVILEEESISDFSLASSLGVPTPSPNCVHPCKQTLWPMAQGWWWKGSSCLGQTFPDYAQPCEVRALLWAPSALCDFSHSTQHVRLSTSPTRYECLEDKDWAFFILAPLLAACLNSVFIQQTFPGHLLCARHCSRHCG